MRGRKVIMKLKFDIRSLTCGALVGAAIILLTGAAGERPQNTGWEYTTWTYGGGFQPQLPELNKRGEDGWELAAPLDSDGGGTRGFVFKRPALRRGRD